MAFGQEQFRILLKNKGLKVTNQRVSILEVLENSRNQHLTTEEIYERVKVDYPEIGLATVYRTLQLLLELHVIDKITLNDGIVRYELGQMEDGEGRHRHHHLICLSCGKLISFDMDLLDELENRLFSEIGFEVKDHEAKFFGNCKACREGR